MQMQVEVLGLKELEWKLSRLPAEVADRIMIGAMRSAAKLIQEDAAGRAPVAAVSHYVGSSKKGKEKVSPGWMREQIRVRRVRGTKLAIEMHVGVSNKAFYWRFIEFGTSGRPAKPFLRPAFEARKVEAAEMVKTVLMRRIKAAEKKLARERPVFARMNRSGRG